MLKLTRYLKPYLGAILLAIALLFVQVNADLALPDYLSRIVNTGIQQGGVENALPVAIRQSQMERLWLFMAEADKEALLDKYTLVNADSADYEEYLETYPLLENEAIYVVGDLSPDDIDALNVPVGQAWTVVAMMEKVMEDPEAAADMMGSVDSPMAFDLSQLPPGIDIFTVLGQLPNEVRTQMMTMMNEQFVALGDSMIIQSAVQAVRAEYEALGMNMEHVQTTYILRVGALMLLLTVVSGACTIVVGLLTARTAAGVSRELRRDVFKKVESFSSTEFDKFSTASLITRTTNDITQIQMLIMMMMRLVVFAPIMGVGGIIRAMSKGSSMWWLIAVAVGMLISLIVTVFSVALPKFRIIQKLIDRLNLVARENLTGMMVIRAFNMQAFEEKRFDTANRDLTDISLFINRVMVVMMPAMMFIMNGLSMMIIWVGAHQIAEAQMQVGDMIAFLQYAMQIVMAFLMLSFMFIMLPRASVSGDRIAEVLETDLAINDPETPQTWASADGGDVKGRIEFRNVSFRYPGADEDVLHDINFTAQPGQTTAFIGSTGSGKSTVINLIPRFYDVTTGAILVDGIDVRNVTQHTLRDKIGYVPQKGTLFSGTIASNLRYADKDASDEVLKLAADIAQATEFIESKEEGMASDIAQGGANVSGGQKQRLSIARALVKQPPIFIFDDSFSALDFRTDAALRKALKAQTGASTVLIVAQRVSTVKTAEQIIVLDEGQMVGKGTHAELMASCEAYREIALSQLSMEELA